MQPRFIKLFLFSLISYFITSICFAEELIIEPDMGRAPLLNAIHSAKNSIELAVYGLTDKDFIQALTTAQRNQKNITILLEKNPYKNEHENDKAIDTLQNANVRLQWPDSRFQLLHQKTFIFDNSSAIVMTFNLTHSAFTRERNFALVITDPALVQEIHRVFLADLAHEKITVTNSALVWSPDNSRKKIADFIKSAQSEIEIYAQDITDYQLIGTLAKAARNGVKIKILISRASNPSKINYLKNSKVTVHVSNNYYIHAKVIIIDHKAALLGSINLTAPSINKNRELSVITHNQTIVDQLSATFDNDWHATRTVRNSFRTFPTLKIFREFRHLWETA